MDSLNLNLEVISAIFLLLKTKNYVDKISENYMFSLQYSLVFHCQLFWGENVQKNLQLKKRTVNYTYQSTL